MCPFHMCVKNWLNQLNLVSNAKFSYHKSRFGNLMLSEVTFMVASLMDVSLLPAALVDFIGPICFRNSAEPTTMQARCSQGQQHIYVYHDSLTSLQ